MDYSVYSNPRAQQRKMPQTSPIPGKAQVKNNAGGYVFALSKWEHLDRFLILGSEGGTYYASEQKLSTDNIANLRACIEEDGCRVVDRAVELSQSGRAPKNDPALFVLALVASDKRFQGNRQYAISQFHKAARTGTHLFHFAQFVTAQRGWGRALKRGIGDWYSEKAIDDLVYQLSKYKSRDGWSHRDLLRLSHPRAKNPAQIELFKKIAYDNLPEDHKRNPELERYYAAEHATYSSDVKQVVDLISRYNLPHEVINRDLLTDKKIWEALLEHMPLGAMIRNLGKLTNLGLLEQGSIHERHVIDTLRDANKIKKARIHPINVLAALKTYSAGNGMKTTWIPKRRIIDALDSAFYSAFGSVEATGNRILMGIDISGSMFGNKVNGMPSLDAATVAAAMALITYSVEENVTLKGFTCEGSEMPWFGSANSKPFMDLAISPRMPLDSVVQYMATLQMGRTDCSLPMRWATENKAKVDTFIVYTDNETYGGQQHVCQALQNYRNKSGINAKLIVAGVTSTGFSIADPNDSGMLDVVGFDSAAPQIMSDFMRY